MNKSCQSVPIAGANPPFSVPEEALLRVVRLDQALLHHPLFPAWRQRCIVAESLRLAASEGIGADGDGLPLLLAGIGVSRATRHPGMARLLELLVALRNLVEGAAAADIRAVANRMGAVVRREDGLLPSLLAGLQAARQDGAGRTEIMLALPLTLADIGVTRCGPLPGLTATSALGGSGPDFISRGIQDLDLQAQRGLIHLSDMDAVWRFGRQRVARQRSAPQLAVLVDYVLAQQLVSTKQVARHLSLPPRRAQALLERLAELQVVQPKAYPDVGTVYTIRPVATATASLPDHRRASPETEADGTTVVPIGPENLLTPADDLSRLLAETDEAVTRVRQRLSQPILPFRLDPE